MIQVVVYKLKCHSFVLDELIDSYEVCNQYITTGWPNKNRTFLRYHIFAATTDIIMWFFAEVLREITAENNKRQFFKRVLNILCKLVRM